MERKTLKILYLIQLPPPVHGVSTVNSLVYHSEVINGDIDKCLLELKFSTDLSELRRNDPGKIVRFLKLAGALRSILREERPDRVYFSLMPVGKGFWRDLLFIRIIKKYGIRIIYHLHNRGIMRRSGNPFWRSVYRYAFSGSVIIHLSEGLLSREIAPLRLSGIVTHAVANGIPDVVPGPGNRRSGKFTLLFLSNFFPEKGLYDALRILSVLRNRHPEIGLRLVGSFLRERHRRRLIRMISALGLSDAVSVAGPQYGKDKVMEYRNADIFLFPSYFKQECFPLVLLEAMSCSLPIVSSNIGAIPEIIEQNREGILVPGRDIQGFAREIEVLSGDPGKRRKLGMAARKKFEGTYRSEHFEEEMKKVFSECRTS